MLSNEVDPKIIEKVNRAVFQKFPNFDDSNPKVFSHENGHIQFIYRMQAATADAHVIPLTLRVTVDSVGTIIKISSSR